MVRPRRAEKCTRPCRNVLASSVQTTKDCRYSAILSNRVPADILRHDAGDDADVRQRRFKGRRQVSAPIPRGARLPRLL